MFDLSITVYEIFASSMRRTLTWTLELSKIKFKFANGKPTHDFLYDGNSNVRPSLTVNVIFANKIPNILC